jgi:CheY-like chemotaxis protein
MPEPDEKFTVDELPTGVNRATLRSARIVVVDDDPDARALLSSALRHDGHDVLEAVCGMDALTRVSSMMLAGLDEPDVIVTDIRMRGVNGLALIAGLRVAGCKAPVVVMTAYTGDTFREHAERLGASAFFVKPLDIDELRTVVLDLIMQQ